MFCNVGFAEEKEDLFFNCKDLEGNFPSRYKFSFKEDILYITNYEGNTHEYTIISENNFQIKARTLLTTGFWDVVFDKKTLISEIYGDLPDGSNMLFFKEKCVPIAK